MRALVEDPRELTLAQYRRFLRRLQIAGPLPDHHPHGEPYLTLNAIAISGAEGARLRRITRIFSSIFHKAGVAIHEDTALLTERMGFPWPFAEALAQEPPRMPILARFDLVSDRAGEWWVLECNADTPSGIREGTVADHLVFESLPQTNTNGLVRPNAGLHVKTQTAFLEAILAEHGGSAFGLIGNPGDLEEMAQMIFLRTLVVDPLRELGIDVVLADGWALGATDLGLFALGKRLGCLYRYIAFEKIFGKAPYAALSQATMSRKVALLNGLYGLLLQNKAISAWIWEHRDSPLFTVEEQDAIHRHLPPTWFLDKHFDRSDRSAPLLVKQFFGREGARVHFTDDFVEAEWQFLIKDGTYVVQRRIELVPIRLVLPSTRGSELKEAFLSLGCFAIDGDWAGYYSRIGGKITTNTAKWIAIYEEAQ